MRCEGFEQRLNELLDERRCLDTDSELTAHLVDCADCRALLAGYEALLEGLDARAEIDPPRNLADRVTAQLAAPPAGRAMRIAGGLSLAASLLIALTAWLLHGRGPVAPAVTEPAATADNNFAAPGAPVVAATEGAVAGEAPIDYRSMFQRTGQAMATLPDTMRRTPMPPEIGAVAEGFRPVTASFSAVLDTLRRTLPSKSDGSKS